MPTKRVVLARARKAAGFTQEELAHRLGVDRSTVGRWELGETEPQPWLQPRLAKALGVSRTELAGMLHELSMASSRLPAGAVPIADHDEEQHLSAALADAHRYLDEHVVDYFRRQLTDCMADDGVNGPTRTLPVVLGIVGVVQQHARSVKPAVRRLLLLLGAQSAEFAGWLYRDASQADRSLYWRDRAAEWALEAGEWPMLGYILLRKSQSAWDERDGIHMLTLAQAAQEGPWTLPVHVQAEAVQQEARALAMTHAGLDSVERKLDTARTLFATADTTGFPGSGLGRHYSEQLLTIQTAISYSEAGRPLQAAALFQLGLTDGAFSYRDRGYFLSLLATSLALAGESDDACTTGWDALTVASRTDSKRTKRELGRLCDVLAPLEHQRSMIREFTNAVTLSAMRSSQYRSE